MKWNLKQIGPATAAAMLAMTSLVNADSESTQLRNLENRVNALEQKKNGNGMVNPAARPMTKGGVDAYVYGDVLYMTAREGGLNYGIQEQGTISDTAINDGKVKTLQSPWDVGFRIGVGYDMPHDGWDLSLSWLRFKTHATHNNSGSCCAPASSDDVYPSLINPDFSEGGQSPIGDLDADIVFTDVDAHWKLLLNQLDLDLGREFFVSKWLTIRPHFGVRADWIKQTNNVEYEDALAAAGDDAEIKRKDHWWGVGVEGGLDTQWGMGYGFSIYGNLTAAILYGKHSIRHNEEDETIEAQYSNVHGKPTISHPVLDMMLGLRWDHMFSHDRFHLGFRAGWEQHVYFSQNQMMRFNNSGERAQFISNEGDLTLQGWTFGAVFGF